MSFRRKRGEGDPEETGEALNGFRRVRGGGATATFVPSQAGIIRSLVTQIAELVGSEPGTGGTGAAEPGPGEPALTDDAFTGRAPGRPGSGTASSGPDAAGADRPPDPLDDLARLLGQVGETGPATRPDDPVLARLLPDAYADDAEAAGDFRRFTEQELRNGKAAAARTVLATLPARRRPGPSVGGRSPGLAARPERRPAGPRGPPVDHRGLRGPAAGPRPG